MKYTTLLHIDPNTTLSHIDPSEVSAPNQENAVDYEAFALHCLLCSASYALPLIGLSLMLTTSLIRR